jgi:hypothetical protein
MQHMLSIKAPFDVVEGTKVLINRTHEYNHPVNRVAFHFTSYVFENHW